MQIFGEDEAFELLKAMHENVNQYTKSGSAPIKAAARGETTIGITFMHDMVTEKVQGFPIEIVSPCEGTGYEIGSMSIIKGARNPESAQKWYDWALTADAQELAAKAQAYQVPSNKDAVAPPEAPDLEQIELIDYDFKKYGSSDERVRLLKKWDDEVNVAAALRPRPDRGAAAHARLNARPDRRPVAGRRAGSATRSCPGTPSTTVSGRSSGCSTTIRSTTTTRRRCCRCCSTANGGSRRSCCRCSRRWR